MERRSPRTALNRVLDSASLLEFWIFSGRKLERDVSPPFAESSAIFRRRPAQKKIPAKAI